MKSPSVHVVVSVLNLELSSFKNGTKDVTGNWYKAITMPTIDLSSSMMIHVNDAHYHFSSELIGGSPIMRLKNGRDWELKT